MAVERTWHGTRKSPLTLATIPKADQIVGQPCVYCGNTVAVALDVRSVASLAGCDMRLLVLLTEDSSTHLRLRSAGVPAFPA